MLRYWVIANNFIRACKLFQGAVLVRFSGDNCTEVTYAGHRTMRGNGLSGRTISAPAMLAILLFTTYLPCEAVAEVIMTPSQAIARMIPGSRSAKRIRIRPTEAAADSIAEMGGWRPVAGKRYTFLFGKDDAGDLLPNMVFIFSEHGKHGPITMAVCLDSSSTVFDLAVLYFVEQRGRPIKERRFLSQFFGKNPESAITLGRDIIGITGATLSSTAATRLVRAAVEMHRYYFAPKVESQPTETKPVADVDSVMADGADSTDVQPGTE